MAVLRPFARVLFALGAALLALAILLFFSSRQGPGDGFADLAAITGALLAAMLAGAAFGGHLLLTRLSRGSRPSAPVAGIALAGSVVGLAAALWVGFTALSSPHLALLLFVGFDVAVVIAGFAAAPGLLTRRAATQ